jgi:Fe2+ or Zn2+ uptake regulation protein
MNQSAQNLLRQTLKTAGYSLTQPREVVFGVLESLSDPISMHDLYAHVSGQLDRSSLYRTIELFERTNIVQRVNMGWKYRLELTDLFAHHHHHIACLSCGMLSAISEDAKVEQLIHELANASGYTPIRHQLEIQGLCPSCQAKPDASA